MNHSRTSLIRSCAAASFAVTALSAQLLFPATPSKAEQPPKGLSSSDWQTIRGEYERHRHAATADPSTPGAYRARNPEQRWMMRFDGQGFAVEPEGAAWSWGLALKSYGRAGAPQPLPSTARITTKD